MDTINKCYVCDVELTEENHHSNNVRVQADNSNGTKIYGFCDECIKQGKVNQ